MNNWKVGDKARYKNSFDVQITHVSKYCFIGKVDNKGESYGLLGDLTPIKSSEQIERQKAIEELARVFDDDVQWTTSKCFDFAESAIKAGYHSQPKVKEFDWDLQTDYLNPCEILTVKELIKDGYIIEKKEQNND